METNAAVVNELLATCRWTHTFSWIHNFQVSPFTFPLLLLPLCLQVVSFNVGRCRVDVNETGKGVVELLFFLFKLKISFRLLGLILSFG